MFFISKETQQINNEIKDKELRVISADGEQLGIMSASDALHIAETKGLDLVKIAPQVKPPVCKIMDYSKFRYEQAKREKENRKIKSRLKQRKFVLVLLLMSVTSTQKLIRQKSFLRQVTRLRFQFALRVE